MGVIVRSMTFHSAPNPLMQKASTLNPKSYEQGIFLLMVHDGRIWSCRIVLQSRTHLVLVHPVRHHGMCLLSGHQDKEVDKAMKQLKEEGAIVSPVRCKWAPAE